MIPITATFQTVKVGDFVFHPGKTMYKVESLNNEEVVLEIGLHRIPMTKAEFEERRYQILQVL